jgi:hypothetical protein
MTKTDVASRIAIILMTLFVVQSSWTATLV